MIFQGAPGAGKTALMMGCMEAVCQHSRPEDPWVAVLIAVNTLKSPTNVIRIMIEGINQERERLAKLFPDQLSVRLENVKELGLNILTELAKRTYILSAGGVSLSSQSRPNSTQAPEEVSAEMAFQEAIECFSNISLVIFVDEAQNTPVTESTKDVVDCLHRCTHGISLVAAFFGLSDTKQVLRQCGLSRFPRDRVVTLETMSYEEAASAIQAAFDAYDFKVPEQAKWIDDLAKLSQGWPQHINSVTVSAGQIIHEHGSSIQPDLLEQVIELSRERKDDYYVSRLDACSEEPWVYKQLAEAAGESDGVLAQFEIDKLTEASRKKSIHR